MDQALALLSNTYDYFNAARGSTCIGATCSGLTSMIADSPVSIGPWLNPNRKLRVVVIQGGINDFVNSRTLTQVENDTQTLCQQEKNAGAYVIVTTMEDTGAVSQSTRVALNSFITTNAVSGGWANAVADWGASSTIGCNLCHNDPTRFIDGTHMTDLGNADAAAILKDQFVIAGMN